MTSGKAADSNFWPRCASPVEHDAELEHRIADLLSRMTLEQKIGQMIQAVVDVRKGARGPELIRVLGLTASVQLVSGLGLAIGIAVTG